jgi:hypothetical protein
VRETSEAAARVKRGMLRIYWSCERACAAIRIRFSRADRHQEPGKSRGDFLGQGHVSGAESIEARRQEMLGPVVDGTDPRAKQPVALGEGGLEHGPREHREVSKGVMTTPVDMRV